MSIDQALIKQINALAKKQKEQGLTEQEKQTQKKLREQYLAAFREQFRQMLDDIEIVDGEELPQ